MHPFSAEVRQLGFELGTERGEIARRLLESVYAAGQRDAAAQIVQARSVLRAMAEASSHLVVELASLTLNGLPLSEQQVERIVLGLEGRLDRVVALADRRRGSGIWWVDRPDCATREPVGEGSEAS